MMTVWWGGIRSLTLPDVAKCLCYNWTKSSYPHKAEKCISWCVLVVMHRDAFVSMKASQYSSASEFIYNAKLDAVDVIVVFKSPEVSRHDPSLLMALGSFNLDPNPHARHVCMIWQCCYLDPNPVILIQGG